jgi:hypothetical protein
LSLPLEWCQHSGCHHCQVSRKRLFEKGKRKRLPGQLTLLSVPRWIKLELTGPARGRPTGLEIEDGLSRLLLLLLLLGLLSKGKVGRKSKLGRRRAAKVEGRLGSSGGGSGVHGARTKGLLDRRHGRGRTAPPRRGNDAVCRVGGLASVAVKRKHVLATTASGRRRGRRRRVRASKGKRRSTRSRRRRLRRLLGVATAAAAKVEVKRRRGRHGVRHAVGHIVGERVVEALAGSVATTTTATAK